MSMKKNLTIVGIFAALFSVAFFGAANAGELPKNGFSFDCAVSSEPAVSILGRPCHITDEFAVTKSDRLPAFAPSMQPKRAVDAMLTAALTAPSQFVREPRGTLGFLGGLPLMKVVLAPPRYVVFPPVQAACFGYADPEGMKCIGQAIITVWRAPSPYGCAGFGDPEGLVCDPRVIPL